MPWSKLRSWFKKALVRVIKFSVLGVPKAKARHRSVPFRRGDGKLGVTSYADKPTEQYEAFVALCAMNAGIEMKTYTGAVELSIVARFPVSKTRRKKLQEGERHTQKPDEDNVLKSIKDGLNRVAWYDDSQVSDAHVAKRWTHGEPGVDVEISYLED